MDKLINAGKDFLEEKVKGDNKDNNNNRQDYHAGGNQSHGGSYPAGGGFSRDDDDDENDLREAREEAERRAGSSGSSDLFSTIAGAIGQKKSSLQNEDLDEDYAVKKHKQNYKDDDDDDADEKSLGAAAAIQALKMFNQGETGEKQSKGAFLGLAMSEASKLFDDKASKGKVGSNTSKENVIQSAGEMAMKMYFKSQGQQQGGLMGLASKFM